MYSNILCRHFPQPFAVDWSPGKTGQKNCFVGLCSYLLINDLIWLPQPVSASVSGELQYSNFKELILVSQKKTQDI